MNNILKKFLSQNTINLFFHLPKAVLANLIYGFPTRRLKVIGITGTDGKTTTTNMVYQILKAAGKKVSMVSTINAVIAGKEYDTGFHVSSPDPFTVQSFAKKAALNNEEYLILETTSHAIDQYRFWGIKFDVGIITNITHDHLDYHKTIENYFHTKLKLIENVNFAIVNQSIKPRIKTKGKLITFGLEKGDFNQKDIKLKLKIPGDYNIENALATLAAAFSLGIKREIAQKALENFSSLKGRMEEVENSKGLKIVIDFASTPNGLEQSLRTLKKLTKGRLISVFGSAGLRDVEKRSMMGGISANLANFTVITSEDPRGYLEVINRQIIQGAEKMGAKKDINFFVIEDRQKAIDFAINKLAKKGDTIGIFGKGHETSMNLDGKKELPWSDFEAVYKALENG